MTTRTLPRLFALTLLSLAVLLPSGSAYAKTRANGSALLPVIVTPVVSVTHDPDASATPVAATTTPAPVQKPKPVVTPPPAPVQKPVATEPKHAATSTPASTSTSIGNIIRAGTAGLAGMENVISSSNGPYRSRRMTAATTFELMTVALAFAATGIMLLMPAALRAYLRRQQRAAWPRAVQGIAVTR